MAALSLEERVAALEAELGRIKQHQAVDTKQKALPWWEQIRGTFKNDPAYEEAMRLGREYRESLHPQETEGSGC